jgi:hypothetical protein
VTGGAVVRSNADGAPGLNGPPGPAILTRGGSIRLDPSVRLVSPSFSPSITGPGTVVGLTIPSLSFTRPSAGTFSLTIRGEPGSLTLTAFDLPRPVVPTPSGDLWVDPRSAILDQAVLPPTGTRVVAGSLPPLPPFLTLAVQSVSLPPAGGIVLGAPVRVVFD